MRRLSCFQRLAIIFLFALSFRVLGQGSLSDPSFDVGSGADGYVYAILVQADGKILVGGDFQQIASQTHPYLVRLNSDGQLDQTFPAGTDGPVYRLLSQPDGKILVGGSFTYLQGVARPGIGRLLTNGSVDLSFDAGLLPGSEKSAFALGFQPDGKILYGNLAPDGELFRLTTNGQLDFSFVQTNIFHGWYIFAIQPRTNGSILVGGGFQAVNGFATPGLALIDANGQLDPNFTSQLKTNSPPTTLLEQPDGSFLVGGGMWRQNSTNRISLAKLTPSLAWDSNFHPDSFDPDVTAYGYGSIYSLLPLPDGKVLAAGNFEEVGGFWRRGIVRLDSAGKVDPCFDPGLGLAPRYVFGAMTVARQADGRILVGGDFIDLISDSPDRSNIVRLLPESGCDNNRVYLRFFQDGTFSAAATFPPGGTNILQISSNLVDWIDYDSSTRPYLYYPLYPLQVSSVPQIFFRGKKQY
jgi:uncharacterized delta-60 repeat protein